jgi:hypothetical protein
MTADNTMNAGALDLLQLERVTGRCEHKPVDPAETAVDHGKADAVEIEQQSLGQAGHPLAIGGTKLSARMPEPCIRKARTIASLRESAAAIL